MGKKTLVYESHFGGHRSEFVEYILEFLSDSNSKAEIYFLINKGIFNDHKELITFALSQNKQLHVEAIAEDVQKELDNSSSIFDRSLLEKKLLNKYFVKLKIERLVLLELDSYQFILGSWRFSRFRNIQINGILFNPFTQESSNKKLKNVGEKLRAIKKKLRKKLQLKWVLINKGVDSIFVLNDMTGVKSLNKLLFVSNFKYLPDPLKIRPYQKCDIRKRYDIAKDKKILLLVGGIQRRKNIVGIINAVAAIGKSDLSNACLLILGICKDDVLLEEILNAISANNNCQIVFDNVLLNSDEFESAVEEAYLMFTIYKDFYASSGIVNHAAKHGKCMIASEEGVIGDVTKKYKLGVTVDPNSLEGIRDATLSCLKDASIVRYNSDFVKERNYKKFAAMLLDFKTS